MSFHLSFRTKTPLATCSRRVPGSARPLLVAQVHSVYPRTSSAGNDKHGSCEEVAIDWEDGGHGDARDDWMARAWNYAYLDEDEVEANLNDAATYRMLVQRFPEPASNVRLLHSFRDNVTRKLAPVVARAFSSHPAPASLSFQATSDLHVQPCNDWQQGAKSAPPACVAVPDTVGGEASTPAAPQCTVCGPQAAGRQQEPDQQQQQQVADRDRLHVLVLPLESLSTGSAAASSPRQRRRRGSRGAGHTLLQGAGRQSRADLTIA